MHPVEALDQGAVGGMADTRCTDGATDAESAVGEFVSTRLRNRVSISKRNLSGD